MKILVYDETITSLFSSGQIVFYISKIDVHKQIPITGEITKEQYEAILYKHQYTPLLFMTPLPQRLAYLFGCCNEKFNIPRDSIFIFYFKYKHSKSEWNKWFTIEPHRDSIYGIETVGGGYKIVQ